ncbi:MAG: copper chaperone Copz family protein [Nitrospinae bacterium]|nr:copper chaperone Copz family protein [Nitrospinota bacterium]
MNETCLCPPQAGAATCEWRVSPSRAPCPTCQKTGRSVDLPTLKALLAVPLTEVRPVEYRFCRTPDCPTVYYSIDGAQRFGENDVRERVYQKRQTDDDVFVCYCFRHTVGSIKEEFARTHTSTVVAAVTAGIEVGQCACEIRNPQGSCCLGNIRAVAQRLETEA